MLSVHRSPSTAHVTHTHTHEKEKKADTLFFLFIFFFDFYFFGFSRHSGTCFFRLSGSQVFPIFFAVSLTPAGESIPPPSHSCYGNAKWARRAREFFFSRSEKETLYTIRVEPTNVSNIYFLLLYISSLFCLFCLFSCIV
jgi:hypothetical protein